MQTIYDGTAFDRNDDTFFHFMSISKKILNIAILEYLFNDLSFAEMDIDLRDKLEKYDLEDQGNRILFIQNHLKSYFDKSSNYVKEQIKLSLLYNLYHRQIDYNDIQSANEYFKAMPENQQDFTLEIYTQLCGKLDEVDFEKLTIINNDVKASMLFNGVIDKYSG